MDAISIFISSKQSEFTIERAVLADKVRAISFLEPVIAEEWAPERTPVRTVFLDKVRHCPIYVGLFHRVYSEATELEYRAAIENPYRQTLLYIKHPDGPRDPRLERLVEAVRSNHVTFQFTGVQDLLPVFTTHLQSALVRMVSYLQVLGSQEPAARSRESLLRRRWEAQRQMLLALGLPTEHPESLRLLEAAVARLSPPPA